MIIISAHADTNFASHTLRKENGGYTGYLDNFAGVYAVMRAYFSGRLPEQKVRIVLTDHEETTFQGAIELREQISPDDVVVVVDVTGIVGDWDFTIEKCTDPSIRKFLTETLSGFRYRMFEDSPDPIACEDEVDVYKEKCPKTFFLGIPCAGGDYNREPVFCTEASLQAVAEALIRIADHTSKRLDILR